MFKDMEKIYDTIYRDNDKYARIYGLETKSAPKSPADSNSGDKCSPAKRVAAFLPG